MFQKDVMFNNDLELTIVSKQQPLTNDR